MVNKRAKTKAIVPRSLAPPKAAPQGQSAGVQKRRRPAHQKMSQQALPKAASLPSTNTARQAHAASKSHGDASTAALSYPSATAAAKQRAMPHLQGRAKTLHSYQTSTASEAQVPPSVLRTSTPASTSSCQPSGKTTRPVQHPARRRKGKLAHGAAGGAPIKSGNPSGNRITNKQQYQAVAVAVAPAPPPSTAAGIAAVDGDLVPVKKKKWHPKKRPKVAASEVAAGGEEVTDAAPAVVAAPVLGLSKAMDQVRPVGKGGAAGVVVKTSTAIPGFGGVVSSNWQSLKKVIGAHGHGKKRKAVAQHGATAAAAGPVKRPGSIGPDGGVTPVNNDGNVLMDVFVQPREAVTDYRTRFSGVRPADLASATAISLQEAQLRVAEAIKNRTLVGHALHNDLKVLELSHPRRDVRDTAGYPPLMSNAVPGRKPRARALRYLAREHLGLTIQEGEHSPLDDARCALYLYHKHRREWEQAIRSGSKMLQARAPKSQARTAKRVVSAKDVYQRDVRDDPMADL